MIKVALIDWKDTLIYWDDASHTAAAKPVLFPSALEQLKQLQEQGYLIVITSNKDQDYMQIEYDAVIKNYPQLAGLIPKEHVFATANPNAEKPNDFLYRQALATLQASGKLSLKNTALELLIIGDSVLRDAKAASNLHNTLFGDQDHFVYGDKSYPTPHPYASQIRFALFDPQKKHLLEQFTALKTQGIDAFTMNSWEALNQFLSGNMTSKPETKRPHSADEIQRLAIEYLNRCEPGYYLLRTKPRTWAQLTQDKKIIIGNEASPKINGELGLHVVDIDEQLKPDRNRIYPQTLFVYNGKVFNAAAYVCFKDPQGRDNLLVIEDHRQWNVPIGRVDGDELTKAQNQHFLKAVRGRGLEETHCILAALRELQEEAGPDLSQFINEERTRILVYSSNNISGDILSDETNYATTVTTQVIIDLGKLTEEEIKQLQTQLHPQEREQIKNVKLIPVTQITKRINPENNTLRYTLFGQGFSSAIREEEMFHHVGRVITTLQAKKLMPFDSRIQPEAVKNKEETAAWYVLASHQAIPVSATIYDPASYLNDLRTAGQLQKDTTLCQQMTGSDAFNFSPERLALHETILALSVYYKWSGEDTFIDAVQRIYEQQVKPFVAANHFQFVSIATRRETEVSQIINKKSASEPLSDAEKLILGTQISFDSALNANQLRYEKLDAKVKAYNNSQPGAARPTPAERQDHQRLAELISNAKKTREFIIEQTAVTQLVQQDVTQLLRSMLFEQKDGSSPLLRDAELVKSYNLQPKTFYSNPERRSVLVAGGAASGKGRVTEGQLEIFKNDMLELNPDLYKKLLLPMSSAPEEIKMHGTRTHNESSLVFDKLIDYWSKLAAEGHAPHTLIDIARAGSWIRGKLSVGGTQIVVHTPLLSVLEALNRSFERGKQTGRFMTTGMLIQGHKDQVFINLEAMRSGCEFTFYDTSVGFHDDLPITAKYSPASKRLDIHNISAMIEYFQKTDLRSTAINVFTLWGHTPKSTIGHMLNYADHMLIRVYDRNGTGLAYLSKEDDRYTLNVADWKILQRQLGVNCDDFLQGLIENKVKIQHTSPELETLIRATEEKLRHPKQESDELLLRETEEFDEMKFINTACKLIEHGTDYVRNQHNLWVYTPPNSPEEFNQQFPKGIKLVKTSEHREQKLNIYRPGDQLTFDIREFPTSQQCEQALNTLREEGSITSQHITLTNHVNENYARQELASEPSTIERYIALPKKVRAFMIDNIKDLQVISSNGRLQIPRLNGWVKCSEENILALTVAVKNFRSQPDNAEYKRDLIHATLGKLYISGAFNIEDGYDYYVSQTELNTVLERLLHRPSSYTNQYTNEKFIAIKLDFPLTLRKDERMSAGYFIFLAEKDRDVLAKALVMRESPQGSSEIDLDKIPGLTVLSEDDLRRTYKETNQVDVQYRLH